MRGVEPQARGPSSHEITEPLRPATSKPTRIRTRTCEVGARCAALTPRVCKRTTRIERASPGWRPGALPSELRPRVKHARLESNQRPLPSQGSAQSTELRAFTSRLWFVAPGAGPEGTVFGHTAPESPVPGAAKGGGGARPRRAASSPASDAREPSAGVEPAPRPYKGRVLAVDT